MDICVSILYSSVDYDEFIGCVIDTLPGSKYSKDMMVCIILDYNKQLFNFNSIDPLLSLYVSEDYVFALPNNINKNDSGLWWCSAGRRCAVARS